MSSLIATTVTQKGQITIPKKLRDGLGMKKYDKVYLELKKGHLRIFPSFDLLDLAGKYKKGKKPVMGAREKMEKGYRRF